MVLADVFWKSRPMVDDEKSVSCERDALKSATPVMDFSVMPGSR